MEESVVLVSFLGQVRHYDICSVFGTRGKKWAISSCSSYDIISSLDHHQFVDQLIRRAQSNANDKWFALCPFHATNTFFQNTVALSVWLWQHLNRWHRRHIDMWYCRESQVLDPIDAIRYELIIERSLILEQICLSPAHCVSRSRKRSVFSSNCIF